MSVVILTGVSGLLGQHIAHACLASNYKVIGICRKLPNTPVQNVEYQLADTSEIEDLLLLDLPESAIWIHTAALVSFRNSDKQALYKNNVIGTRNCTILAKELNAKCFIHISSIAALGKSYGNSIVDIETEVSLSDLNPYGRSKYLAELEVERAKAEGLFAHILNPGIILGTGSPTNPASQIVDLVRRNSPFYTLGETLYTDARDIAKAVILLFNQEKEVRAIIGGFHLSNQEIQNKLAQILGKSGPKWFANASILRIAYYVFQIRALLLIKQNPLHIHMIKSANSIMQFDKHAILKELDGFSYTEENETLEWVCGEFN